MKNRKRILAAVLTAIMTISMMPANTFATENVGNEEAEPAVEAVSVSTEEQEVETTVEDISEDVTENVSVESSETVEAEDTADPEAEETVETVEETVETVEETVETVEETVEQTEEESNSFTLTEEGDDYIVTLTYDASALLPEDVDIEVKEIKENARKYDSYCDQALEAVQKEDDDAEEISYIRLFDITLVNAEGKEVQPAAAVDVKISLKDVKKADDNTQVVHFAGEKEVPEVINPDVEGDTLVFETEGFSIYAVLTTGETGDNARLEVIFKNGETTFNSIYVKKADVIKGKLNEVLYDPGEPESADGKTFLGWTDQESYTMETDRMTIEEVREDVKAKLNAGVKEGDTATYYAVMFKAISLYYQDRYENTYRTESLLTTDNSATTTVDQEYTMQGANPSEGFVGWVVKGTEETEGHTVYKNGDQITISQDTTLIPEIGQGTWLFFDSNAGGAGVSEASYTAPKFIPVGDTPAKPADPTRPGYTFAGWFEGPEDSAAAFDFNKQMSEHTAAADGYVYAYAHWTPNPTGSYKVIIWAQKVTDDKNAADSAKTYDYVATYTINDAVAGTALTKEELGKSSNNYFTKDNAFFGATDLQHGSKAFVYRTFTVDHGIGADGKGVSPDDSTVVNVYYDRAPFTIYFTGEPGGVTIEHYNEVDGGENVYGLVDGEYVKLTTTVSNKRIEWSKIGGNLALPSSITRIRWSNKTGGDWIYSDQEANVSDLQGANAGGPLINYPVGESSNKAYVNSGNKYLYTTNSTGTSNYCQLKWTIAGDYAYTTPDGTTYTGQVYEKQSATGVPYTGLYGQTLEQNGYTWLTPSGSAQSWNELSWLEAFRSDLFGASGLGGIPNVIVAEPETHNTNTTIIFYFEDANNAGQYREVDRVGYYFQQGTNAQYNITERLLGGDFNGYKWSTSEALPSSWEYGIDSSGFTTTKRGNNTYIHIRYKRATYNIVYMQGNATLKTVSDVPYEASLANYAGTVPADSAVTVGENEFFRGWFEDPEGVKRVDWTGKMPAGNKTIYAVVAKAQYHVVIDMDGGTLPNNQSTEFWEDAGNIIDDTNFKSATKTDDQGNVYTLVGYFTDDNYSKQWNFSARLNEEDLWHKYDDTNGDDPYRDSAFFEKGNDVGWYNVSGIFRLFAQWKNDDILSKGGLHIRYKNPDGTVVSTDSMHYADQVDVRAADAPAASFVPEGKRFDGWQLKEGKVYQPTEIFVADSKDAVLENDEYWITLTAVYVDKEEKTPTHIYFYKNDGKTTEPIKKYENVDINVGYEIGAAPTREGYQFLGWAKDIETPVDDEGNPQTDPETGKIVVNTSSDKPVADFLVYDKEEGKYYLPDTQTEVTQVAADEVLPYEALYAIWAPEQFFIYHSSDKADPKLESVNMIDLKNGKFDITAKVTSGCLYGGYYHYEDEVKGKAYDESGLNMTPVANTTYYLKEVDGNYLKPNVYLVSSMIHNGMIRNLYGFVDYDVRDDYVGGGLVITGKESNGEAIEGGEIEIFDPEDLTSGNIAVTQGDKELAPLTAKKLFGVDSAVYGYADLTGYIDFGRKLYIQGYYETKDGVRVTGIKTRVIQFAEEDPQYDYDVPVFTGWNSAGNTACGLATVGSTCTAVEGSNEGGNEGQGDGGDHAISQGLTLRIAADVLTYTITKVCDPGVELQTVEEGCRTGEITVPEREGYYFGGWYTDGAFTSPADFSDVRSDMTVYARYIKAEDVSVSFTLKSSKSGTVTFNATASVKGDIDLAGVTLTANDSKSVLGSRSVKKTGSGKNVKYTTSYKGTAAVKGKSLSGSFAASLAWTTADGTAVSGPAYNCKYVIGKVTVK